MLDLALGLRHALEGGSCVLFIGAGIGEHLHRKNGSPAPNGLELAKAMAEHFGIDADGYYDLAQISQAVDNRKGRKELDTYVRSQLSDLAPDSTFQWLFSRRWRAIYTTNYDDSIERSYDLNPKPLQTPVTMSVTQDIVQLEPRFQVPVIHLHGIIFGPEQPKIVITENDYLRFRERRKMLFELLKRDAATSTFLYIGYSNRDPNWKLVLDELSEEFLISKMPRAYRVSPSTPALELELLKGKGIECIAGNLAEFVEAASASLATAAVEDEFLSRAQKAIPSELAVTFEENPPATTRLLKSWTYVNQAPFSEHPNLTRYLRGDRPNWALIAATEYFNRDLEADLLDDLLDFATSPSTKSVVDVLIGSAGYGVSTVLLAMAVRLVKERAGVVFFLRQGAKILEGDLEFAATIAPDKRLFLFVDDTGEHWNELEAAIQRLKKLKRPVMLMLGSRLNEWRQIGINVSGTEFELQHLSDPEIERLIAYLDKHGELGQLTDLPHALRFSAIKSKHDKQLLVAMREATEGTGFDAIIESEFRNIGNPVAQRAYLTVCAVYQHGLFMRDGLLASCLSTELSDLHHALGPHTDGVIIFDVLDEYYGIYGCRARHRTIAEIVWLRCGGGIDRDKLLQDALKNINLNYGADKDAFEQFVREDSLVDSIGTLDGKIRYFDTACSKDPDSPYVRQHYARMLAREKKWELAQSQIESAISLNSRLRVLYHTKGKILAGLMSATESEDVARRWLIQAEQAFQRGLKQNPNDPYCLQGLAELYLEWAKRATKPAESTEYITKAEESITLGLRVARERDALRVASSQISEWLGKKTEHLRALEIAVKESPHSIVARFLLGRTYRRGGDPERARQVLESLVQEHPEEFRAAVELARSLMELNEPYSKAIAVLRLSSLQGFSDTRFIATLGGILFLDGQFTEADAVFERSLQVKMSYREGFRAEFKPHDPNDPSRPFILHGTVGGIKGSNAFIDVPGYPRVTSPNTSSDGNVFRKGVTLEFEIAFSPRGAVALNPHQIR